jgi:hypothetical protein
LASLLKEFMSDKDMRLFAVWCARESFKLQKSLIKEVLKFVMLQKDLQWEATMKS